MTPPIEIAESDVLLVVDLQNDFCSGGRLAVPGGEEVVALVNRLARRFSHVVATQDWHPPGHLSFASSHQGAAPFSTVALAYGPQTLWPDHCVQGTEGAEFHPRLDLNGAELIIRKGFRPAIDSYSAFVENDRRTPTGLAGYLRERALARIFIAGLAYDYCVRYSAEDARARGFEVCVIEDACRGIDVEGSVAAARGSFAAAGIARIGAASLGVG